MPCRVSGARAGRRLTLRDVDRGPGSVRVRILQAAAPSEIRAVVIDAETIPFNDVTASRMLAELSGELEHHSGEPVGSLGDRVAVGLAGGNGSLNSCCSPVD